MNAFLATALGLLLLAAPAAAGSDLYTARVIVTGTDLRSRPAGLLTALGDVLAKLTGRAAIREDPRLQAIDPTPMLRAIAYLDRQSDIPMHDEQGTRDRPYDLVARFNPASIDQLLQQWGIPRWTADRPEIRATIEIQPRRGEPFQLAADTVADERHRAALLAAAGRAGLTVILPTRIGPPLHPPPNAVALEGTLVWSDADYGWVGTWSMTHGNQRPRWQHRGGGFDEAYRAAMTGAALILSGAEPP